MSNFKASNTHPHLGLKYSDQAPKDFHFHGWYGCVFIKFLIMPQNLEHVCMFFFSSFSSPDFLFFSLAVEVVFVETQEVLWEVKGDWC